MPILSSATCAGHDRLATENDVRAFLAMLRATVDLVREQLSTGASIEAVRQRGLPARLYGWASSFTSVEAWVARVYTDLSDRGSN